MAVRGIQVDVTNPRDISAKLEQVRQRITRTEASIRDQRQELERLADAENRLAILAGEASTSARPESQDGRSSVQQVIAVLEALGGPAQVGEVLDALDSPLKRKTVGWALWQAEQDNLIRKLEKGIYAPLSYRPVELALDGGRKE